MSSRDTPKTVVLGGDPIGREAVAANGPIKPGMLLALTSAAAVRPHNVAGGAGALFAREMELIGNSIDDDYETGDRVLYCAARKGDRFYALLAAGNDVAIGAELQSDGAGALEAVDGEGEPVVRALQAVDNDPGSGGAAVRIKVEVI